MLWYCWKSTSMENQPFCSAKHNITRPENRKTVTVFWLIILWHTTYVEKSFQQIIPFVQLVCIFMVPLLPSLFKFVKKFNHSSSFLSHSFLSIPVLVSLIKTKKQSKSKPKNAHLCEHAIFPKISTIFVWKCQKISISFLHQKNEQW